VRAWGLKNWDLRATACGEEDEDSGIVVCRMESSNPAQRPYLHLMCQTSDVWQHSFNDALFGSL
jgi:hypothetical protein